MTEVHALDCQLLDADAENAPDAETLPLNDRVTDAVGDVFPENDGV